MDKLYLSSGDQYNPVSLLQDDEYSEQENNDEEDVGEEDDEEEEEKDGFQTLKYKNNRKTTNTGLRLALIVS